MQEKIVFKVTVSVCALSFQIYIIQYDTTRLLNFNHPKKKYTDVSQKKKTKWLVDFLKEPLNFIIKTGKNDKCS